MTSPAIAVRSNRRTKACRSILSATAWMSTRRTTWSRSTLATIASRSSGKRSRPPDPFHDRSNVDALDDAVEIDPADDRVDVQARDHPVEVEPVDHLVELDAFGDELVEVDLVEGRVHDLRDQQPQERRSRVLVARALLAPAGVERPEPLPGLAERFLDERRARQEREEQLGAADHRGGGAGAPPSALEGDPDRRAGDERDPGGRSSGLVAGRRPRRTARGQAFGRRPRRAPRRRRGHPDRDPERLLDELLERRRGWAATRSGTTLPRRSGEAAPSSTVGLSFGVPIITPGRRGANSPSSLGYHRRARTSVRAGHVSMRGGRPGDASRPPRDPSPAGMPPDRAVRAARVIVPRTGRTPWLARWVGSRVHAARRRSSSVGRGGVRPREGTAPLGSAGGPGIRERSQARGWSPRGGLAYRIFLLADPARTVPRERPRPGDRALGGRSRRSARKTGMTAALAGAISQAVAASDSAPVVAPRPRCVLTVWAGRGVYRGYGW